MFVRCDSSILSSRGQLSAGRAAGWKPDPRRSGWKQVDQTGGAGDKLGVQYNKKCLVFVPSLDTEVPEPLGFTVFIC